VVKWRCPVGYLALGDNPCASSIVSENFEARMATLGTMVAENQFELHAAFQGDALKAVVNLIARNLKAIQLPFYAGQKNVGLI
jgi:hypothetical protein